MASHRHPSPSPDASDVGDNDVDESSSEPGDDKVYPVEKILDQATDANGIECYLVKWEGYPLLESTWEPEEVFEDPSTLQEWEEEKSRQHRGLSKPFDIDEFYRLYEKKKKRDAKRRELGLEPLASYGSSDAKGDSSAEEAEEEVPTLEDSPAITRPKKARFRQLAQNDEAYKKDAEMKDASDSSDAALADRRHKSTPRGSHPSTSVRHGQHHGQPITESKISTKPLKSSMNIQGSRKESEPIPRARMGEAPSQTGYQGTANRSASYRTTTSRGVGAVRGMPSRGRLRATRGGSLQAARSQPRGRKTVQALILNEIQGPAKDKKDAKVFINKREERRFELAARNLADRAPSKLPDLFIPGQPKIRKKSSTMPAAVSGKIQPSASISAREETRATAERDDNSAMVEDHGVPYLFDEPEKMPNNLQTTTETEKEILQRKMQDLHGANEARRLSLAAQGISASDLDHFAKPSEQSKRSESALLHQKPSSAVASPSIALPSMSSSSVISPAVASSASPLPVVPSTFDHFGKPPPLGPSSTMDNLDKGPPNGPRRPISEIPSSTPMSTSTGISVFPHDVPAAPAVRKVSLLHYAARQKAASSKVLTDNKEYDDLNEHVFGYKYSSLLPNKRNLSGDLFFLLFPSMTTAIAEHVMAWLRSCSKDIKIFTCQQGGAWLQFLKATASVSSGGSMIIHELMAPLLPRYPKLLNFLMNSSNSVWCVDEDFPDGQILTRLFPQGGTVCLTSKFCKSEPQKVNQLLTWFFPKLSIAAKGTWKLVVCHNLRQYLLDLAVDSGNRRIELIKDLEKKGLDDDDIEVLAARKGFSLKDCDRLFENYELMGKLLHFGQNDNLPDDIEESNESNCPVVYAPKSIGLDDEPELVDHFAWWAMMNLKNHRKFIVIGTKGPDHDRQRMQSQVRSGASSTIVSPSENQHMPVPPLRSISEIISPHSPAEPPKELEPVVAVQPMIEINRDTSDIALEFVAETGASEVEAEEFLHRSHGNLPLAIRLYNIAAATKITSPKVAGPCPSVQQIAAPPAGPDVVMEDAPAAALPSIEPSSKSQPSLAGIITTENGPRLVPSSTRLSGTVRNEINIRPGYVPPEDKEVFQVRRGEGVSMSRSGSEAGSRRVSLDSSFVATREAAVTPAEEGEVVEVEKKVETRPTLEWYQERIDKGDDWKHIDVMDWEKAFKILGISVKK